MSAKKPEAIPFSWLLSTPKLRAALRRSITRGKDDPKLRDAFTVELIAGAAKGAKFPAGKPLGSLSDTTKYIYALATSRDGSAQHLFDNLTDADKKIIGEMPFNTFRRHVGNARKK